MYVNCVEEIIKGYVLGFFLRVFWGFFLVLGVFFLQSSNHLGDHKSSCLYLNHRSARVRDGVFSVKDLKTYSTHFW